METESDNIEKEGIRRIMHVFFHRLSIGRIKNTFQHPLEKFGIGGIN
jgi:hypothetical protein